MASRIVAIVLALVGALSSSLLASSATVGTCLDFESGSLPPSMLVDITNASPAGGRVQVTDAFPHTGKRGLDLDTDCDACGGETRQAVILIADLAGESHPLLQFWVHEHMDENHPQDGIFISDSNGIEYALVLSLNGFPSSYQLVSVDLETAAAGAGMSLVDGFLIKFQSQDNFSIPSDGYSFDDICLIETLFVDGFETGDTSRWSP